MMTSSEDASESAPMARVRQQVEEMRRNGVVATLLSTLRKNAQPPAKRIRRRGREQGAGNGPQRPKEDTFSGDSSSVDQQNVNRGSDGAWSQSLSENHLCPGPSPPPPPSSSFPLPSFASSSLPLSSSSSRAQSKSSAEGVEAVDEAEDDSFWAFAWLPQIEDFEASRRRRRHVLSALLSDSSNEEEPSLGEGSPSRRRDYVSSSSSSSSSSSLASFRRDDVEDYNQMLKRDRSFHNPHALAAMSQFFKINDTASLLLDNTRIPVQNYADGIQQRQSVLWALDLSERAEYHVKEGEYDQAAKLYTQALGLDAKCLPALLGRGTIRVSQANLKGAVADFRRAVNVDPENSEAKIKLRSAETNYELSNLREDAARSRSPASKMSVQDLISPREHSKSEGSSRLSLGSDRLRQLLEEEEKERSRKREKEKDRKKEKKRKKHSKKDKKKKKSKKKRRKRDSPKESSPSDAESSNTGESEDEVAEAHPILQRRFHSLWQL